VVGEAFPAIDAGVPSGEGASLRPSFTLTPDTGIDADLRPDTGIDAALSLDTGIDADRWAAPDTGIGANRGAAFDPSFDTGVVTFLTGGENF